LVTWTESSWANRPREPVMYQYSLARDSPTIGVARTVQSPTADRTRCGRLVSVRSRRDLGTRGLELSKSTLCCWRETPAELASYPATSRGMPPIRPSALLRTAVVMLMRMEARQVASPRLVTGARHVAMAPIELARSSLALVLACGNGFGRRAVVLVILGNTLRRRKYWDDHQPDGHRKPTESQHRKPPCERQEYYLRPIVSRRDSACGSFPTS